MPTVLANEEEWMKFYLPVGIVGVLLYVVGLFALYLYIVVRAPKAIVRDPSFGVRFRFMLMDFRPDMWWWGIVYLARNTLVAMVEILVPEDGELQCLTIVQLLMAALVANCIYAPFWTPFQNIMDTLSLAMLMMIAIAASHFALKREENEPYLMGWIWGAGGTVLLALIVTTSAGLAKHHWRREKIDQHMDRVAERFQILARNLSESRNNEWLRKSVLAKASWYDRYILLQSLRILESNYPSLRGTGNRRLRSASIRALRISLPKNVTASDLRGRGLTRSFSHDPLSRTKEQEYFNPLSQSRQTSRVSPASPRQEGVGGPSQSTPDSDESSAYPEWIPDVKETLQSTPSQQSSTSLFSQREVQDARDILKAALSD